VKGRREEEKILGQNKQWGTKSIEWEKPMEKGGEKKVLHLKEKKGANRRTTPVLTSNFTSAHGGRDSGGPLTKCPHESAGRGREAQPVR